MKTTINIRLATGEDIEVLEHIGDRLFDDCIKTDRALEFLNDTRHHLALAFVEEEVVGMVSGVHYVHPDKEPQLFINELSVVEAYRNMGIGKGLVRYLCQHGKSLGCSEAWVLTEKSNLAAQKTYEGADGVDTNASLVLYEFPLVK